MNYNSTLDAFFGHPWVCFGTLFGLVILGMIFRKKLFLERKYKAVLGILYFVLFLFGLFMILYINPSALGYGYSEGIKDVRCGEKNVFVMDYVIEAGGEGVDPTYHNRIHVIDKKTGKKLRRFLVGPDAKIVFLDEEIIVLERYSDARIYTWNDGKCIAEWTKETLPTLFPQLGGGVDQLSVVEERSGITMTGMDGRLWFIDFKTQTAIPDKNYERTYKASNLFYIRDEWVSFDDRMGGDYRYRLEGTQWGDKRKQLRVNDSVVNPELFFLEGKPLEVSTTDSTLVILYYTTTEKTNFLLSGIHLDRMNAVWSYNQTSMLEIDPEHEDELASDLSPSTHQLFVAARNKVICLDVTTGKELWNNEL